MDTGNSYELYCRAVANRGIITDNLGVGPHLRMQKSGTTTAALILGVHEALFGNLCLDDKTSVTEFLSQRIVLAKGIIDRPYALIELSSSKTVGETLLRYFNL